MNALTAAIADMQASLAGTLEAVHEANANLFLAEKWRLVRAVYGAETVFPAAWPIIGKTTDEVRADCREALEIQRTIGRTGHWSFDGSRLRALVPAERALARMVAA